MLSSNEFALDTILHSELENLLFHRLKPREGKDREEENELGETLSMILDQMHLAESLGISYASYSINLHVK